MSKLLSIIFPTYNVGTKILSLIESFNSLEKNILAEIDFIFVDDKSEQKEDQLIKKNAKFKYRIIKNKKNMGASPSRYEGLKNSTSKYVWFFDPDDCIRKTDFLKLFKIIKQEDYDVILFNLLTSVIKDDCCTYYFDKLFYEIDGEFKVSNFHELKNLANHCGWGLKSASMCDKVFKREFLIKNKINFKHFKIHEDTYTWFQCLPLISNMLYINLYPYIYNRYRGSNSATQEIEEIWKTNCQCMLDVFYDLSLYLDKIEVNKIFRKKFYYMLNHYLYSSLNHTKLWHSDYFEWYEEELKKMKKKTGDLAVFCPRLRFLYVRYQWRDKKKSS